MSDTRELDDVFDELPPNVQQELQALEEIVYQQKQQLAELKTECDKLVDRDSAIIWLRAERDHRRQERDKAQQQLADLKQQLAALREAAQTVVDSQMNARMTQSTHWKDVTVDALAALLEAEK